MVLFVSIGSSNTVRLCLFMHKLLEEEKAVNEFNLFVAARKCKNLK